MKRQDILENQVNYAYLSLGSNLGNKIQNLELAKILLKKFHINVIRKSNYYETKSWPDKSFPNYFNSVVFIKTKHNLKNLFQKIKFIEKKLGRKTTKKNYPRTCDIDIIDFNGTCLKKKYKTKKIQVPHINMHKRNFVLFPMFDLNKNWIHPKNKKNIVNLLLKLPSKDLRTIKII